MPDPLARAQICCEAHGVAVYRKLNLISELSMTRLGTLGAYALDQMTEDELRALHRKVKNTRKVNGRPRKVSA